MAVRFFNADIQFRLNGKRTLARCIQQLFLDYGRQLQEINFIFCSDDYLLEINRSSLNHDYYTDIITFDLSDSVEAVKGELYISIDRVRDNAVSMQQEFSRELHRVIFHGCLHLCGLKDKRQQDIKLMRAAEDKYLHLYFG